MVIIMGKQRKWSRYVFVTLMIFGLFVCDMRVQAASVKLSKTSLTLEVGKTVVLKLKNTKKGKTVKWKSSNTSIAKVSSKGKITALAKGNVKITATYMKKKYVCKVVVRNIQKVDSTPDNNQDQKPEPNPDNNPEQTPGTEPDNPANESAVGEFYDYKIVYDKVVISRIKKIVDKDVVIPETIEGYPVTKLGTGIFEDCEELNSVKLPKGITEIPEEAFSGCKDLTQITFEGKITTIGSKAFYNCLKLEQLDGDWSQVTNIPEGCFKNCNSLMLKELPSELLEIGNQAFYNCDNLGASVLFPRTLVKIGDSAFYDCDNVFSVFFLLNDENQKASIEYIGDYAFAACDKLAAIDTEKATKLKSYGEGCFKDCVSLLSADLGGSSAKYGMEIFSGCKALNRVNFSYGITSVPARTFYECYNLSELTLPASVTKIESQAFSFAFLESAAIRDVRFMVLGDKMDSAPDAFWGAHIKRVLLYYFNTNIGTWGQNIGLQCIKI